MGNRFVVTVYRLALQVVVTSTAMFFGVIGPFYVYSQINVDPMDNPAQWIVDIARVSAVLGWTLWTIWVVFQIVTWRLANAIDREIARTAWAVYRSRTSDSSQEPK